MANRSRDSLLSVGTSSSDDVSWKPFVDEVSWERSRDEIEAPSLENPATVLMGDEALTISMSGAFSMAFDNIAGPMIEASDTYRYIEDGPLGSTTGCPKYTTTYALPMEYEIDIPAKGIVKYSLKFEAKNGTTRGTY